jgi:hypothetical protein
MVGEVITRLMLMVVPMTMLMCTSKRGAQAAVATVMSIASTM